MHFLICPALVGLSPVLPSPLHVMPPQPHAGIYSVTPAHFEDVGSISAGRVCPEHVKTPLGYLANTKTKQ